MSLIKKIFEVFSDKPKHKEPPKVAFLEESNSDVFHTMPMTKETPKQHFIIKHDGQYLIYDSKNKMPEELRKQFECVERIEEITSQYIVIVDGKRLTYKHYNDIPEDIRNLLDEKKSN